MSIEFKFNNHNNYEKNRTKDNESHIRLVVVIV